MECLNLADIPGCDFDSLPVSTMWSNGDGPEPKMHRIHIYPARFPAFLVRRTLEWTIERTSKRPVSIMDIFCGCGTVALEASWKNIDFWGCDINPVATLIAAVKSTRYRPSLLRKFFERIMNEFNASRPPKRYAKANPRLRHWHFERPYDELAHLKNCIYLATNGDRMHMQFFLCAFSSILKSMSRWSSRSVKPQVDLDKTSENTQAAENAFARQFDFMYSAALEAESMIGASDRDGQCRSEIVTGNFLSDSISAPGTDLILTSPPYATSYEYADLHQLSTLWLGYAEDYRQLRNGVIGSVYGTCDLRNDRTPLEKLHATGRRTVEQLLGLSVRAKEKARSVCRYFLDMQTVAQKCHSILNPGGTAVFIVGNTQYGNVKVNNAQHFAESLLRSGFSSVFATKRRIGKKNCTPYRDAKGRFVRSDENRKIYNEEFVLIGRKTK